MRWGDTAERDLERVALLVEVRVTSAVGPSPQNCAHDHADGPKSEVGHDQQERKVLRGRPAPEQDADCQRQQQDHGVASPEGGSMLHQTQEFGLSFGFGKSASLCQRLCRRRNVSDCRFGRLHGLRCVLSQDPAKRGFQHDPVAVGVPSIRLLSPREQLKPPILLPPDYRR